MNVMDHDPDALHTQLQVSFNGEHVNTSNLHHIVVALPPAATAVVVVMCHQVACDFWSPFE